MVMREQLEIVQWHGQIDGFAQDCSISSAFAMEILQSCTTSCDSSFPKSNYGDMVNSNLMSNCRLVMQAEYAILANYATTWIFGGDHPGLCKWFCQSDITLPGWRIVSCHFSVWPSEGVVVSEMTFRHIIPMYSCRIWGEKLQPGQAFVSACVFVVFFVFLLFLFFGGCDVWNSINLMQVNKYPFMSFTNWCRV